MIDLTTDFGQKVKRHLEGEYVVWFTTVGADLTPQPRPVWFIWDGEGFLIFSRRDAHKISHLQELPNVALHFNTDEKGDEAVIVFLGEARIDPEAPPAHEVPAYVKKYRDGIAGLDMTPEEFSRDYSVPIRVVPVKVRGW